MSYADTIVMYANQVGTLDFSSEPDRYVSVIYRHDKPELAKGMARGYPNAKPKPIPPQSCCGLFLAACYMEAGVDFAPLYRPYYGRNDIMTVLRDLGVFKGAMIYSLAGGVKAGDGINVGSGMGAHWILCLEDAEFGVPFRAIQGGQGPGNRIEFCTMKATTSFGKERVVNTANGRGKDFNYMISADLL